MIAGVRKSELAEAKGLNADQVVALDDDAAFDALAPVDVVANLRPWHNFRIAVG